MKKLKNNRSGFVLAETLVVTVFLMIIFGVIYSNFYPLIGEYEKRETYDDIDGKYAAYWIKRLIEDGSYQLNLNLGADAAFKTKGYARFECDGFKLDETKRQMCINLVHELEIENCDKNGNLCDIYITKYQIGSNKAGVINFKDVVKDSKDKKYMANCTGSSSGAGCKGAFLMQCRNGMSGSDIEAKCNELSEKRLFKDSFKEYVKNLPDYTAGSLNYANYRVIISIHHKKDNNNYYSYSTIEVSR